MGDKAIAVCIVEIARYIAAFGDGGEMAFEVPRERLLPGATGSAECISGVVVAVATGTGATGGGQCMRLCAARRRVRVCGGLITTTGVQDLLSAVACRVVLPG